MSNIISYSKVIDHTRLLDRLGVLRALVAAARADAPDVAASPVLINTIAVLLRDIYRLISREPGARTLPRLGPGATPTHRQLAAMLRDGVLALELFKQAHLDHDDEYGDEWLTLECIADFHQRRHSPRDDEEWRP